MRAERNIGSCVAIQSMPLSSSSRCSNGNGSASSDESACGSPRWIGRGLSCLCIKRKGVYERICINLTPLQEALRALWVATYPDEELHGLISEQWKQMGWQGKDPSTDFRGAGFISLENLLFFAKSFARMNGLLTFYIVWLSWLWTSNGWKRMHPTWNSMRFSGQLELSWRGSF